MDIETSLELLYPLFKNIWEEEVLSEWKEGHLINLPKKGDLSSSSNYRGITPLSIPGKVFSRVLPNRMKDVVDLQLQDQQASFCNFVHHPRTVMQMELHCLCQLYWLWEGIW